MLDRARQAAQSARKIAVVEVLGEQAGWIALQAGIAVGADAVLIPEIPCRSANCGSAVEGKMTRRRAYGLVVVAEGAKFIDQPQAKADKPAITPSKLRYRRSQRVKHSEHVIHALGSGCPDRGQTGCNC